MLTILASPDHRCDAGKEIDLPDDFALALVEGGYAIRVDLPAVEPVAEEAEDAAEDEFGLVESAALESEETAALPPTKGKRRS
jgi:hypothetical protein